MTSDTDLVTRIRELQWRQGAVLPTEITEAARAQLPADFEPTDWGIVISQSCDIVHQHKTKPFENEPYIEVLIARRWTGKKPDSTFVAGKNARRILFAGDDTDHGQVRLQASIHERHRVDRKLLATVGPSTSRTLNNKTRQLLIQWVGKRYLRSGYPDGLNIGANPSRKTLESALNMREAIIHSIWMTYEILEDGPDARYHLVFVVAIKQEAVASQWDEQRRHLVDELKAAWRSSHRRKISCPWHETLKSVTLKVEVEVVQAEQMTVQRISDERLKRYDADWITYDSEGDELPFQV